MQDMDPKVFPQVSYLLGLMVMNSSFVPIQYRMTLNSSDLHTSSGLLTSYSMGTGIGGEYWSSGILLLQNTPYCLEEQIRCLDCRDQYVVLSRRVDTSYPTGGYDISVDLSEHDT
ncbi:hypothetical protein Tco_0459294 [Tanacetum coccineum]